MKHSPPAIECLFGPDGVGKSTVANSRRAADKNREQSDKALIVLPGTRVDEWPERYPRLFETELLKPYGGDNGDFLGKIEYVNLALQALAKGRRRTVVDGHPLHKTWMNMYAARLSGQNPESLSREEFLQSTLGRYFVELSNDVSVVHTHVVLPWQQFQGLAAGVELQRRISQRPGGHSDWDPSNVGQSCDQVVAASHLAVLLHSTGFSVDSEVASI